MNSKVFVAVEVSGKGPGKKGKSGRVQTDDGKGKGKSGKWQSRKTFEGYWNHCWKWGHMEKNCFTKTKAKGGQGKSAGSLDESEASGPEHISVGGFGLCSFGNQCDDWKWNNYRIVTYTLDSAAATGEPVQNEGFRVLPIVTEEGLRRCRCAVKVIRIIVDSKPGQSGMLHNTHE